MEQKQSLILSVDCGSTNLKAALFDSALNRVAEHSVSVEYSLDDGVKVEFLAGSALSSWRVLLDSVCSAAGVAREAISCVTFTSQAQTFAFTDAHGQALTPFYSWMDRRAEGEAARLSLEFGSSFHEHCSFAPPIPQLQLAKVLWLHEHLGGDLPPDARLVFLPGYFAMDLGIDNVTDSNLAAMGGLYSLREGGWWDEALSLCGLSASQLPKVVEVGEGIRIGEGTSGFADGCAVVLAGNDQTSGAFANACREGGMVVTLGTALVVYRYAGEEPGPYHAGACWGPYPGGGYYELATRVEGCRALDWAREKLMAGRSAAAFDQAAQDVLGEHGIPADEWCLFYPQRIGGDGAWCGSGTLGERAHAVLEGIAFLLRHLVETELETNRIPSEITVTGGGSHSTLWLQLLADILGYPVRPGAGDSLLGAAMMCSGPCCTCGGVSASSLPLPANPVRARQRAYQNRYEVWVAGADKDEA